MNLTPGSRIAIEPRRVYDRVAPAWETPRHVWFRARKAFWNYREQDRSLYETAPDEALGVLVRVSKSEDVDANRRALDFELERVLSLTGIPWLPEPLDVLDDPPALILSDPHGRRLAETEDEPARPVQHSLRLAGEWRAFLGALHERGLIAGRPDPPDLVTDAAGCWTFLGTDRIRPCQDDSERKADLAAWAELARPLVARARAAGRLTPEAEGDLAALIDNLSKLDRGGWRWWRR